MFCHMKNTLESGWTQPSNNVASMLLGGVPGCNPGCSTLSYLSSRCNVGYVRRLFHYKTMKWNDILDRYSNK